MTDLQNATSPPMPPALPDAWAEKIFRRMENFYGAKWVDSLGGIPRDRVRQCWAEELADHTPAELKRGLESCRSRTWPPTLPEFLMLCRPPHDPRADWVQACEQMAIRVQGQGGDTWSRPQVYWAAVAIGAHDLRSLTWAQVGPRWEHALANASSDPIPEFSLALPPPGHASLDKQQAQALLDEARARIEREFSPDAIKLGRQWAVDLMHKEASGQPIAFVAHAAWREALGFEHGIDAKTAIEQTRKAA